MGILQKIFVERQYIHSSLKKQFSKVIFDESLKSMESILKFIKMILDYLIILNEFNGNSIFLKNTEFTITNSSEFDPEPSHSIIIG